MYKYLGDLPVTITKRGNPICVINVATNEDKKDRNETPVFSDTINVATKPISVSKEKKKPHVATNSKSADVATFVSKKVQEKEESGSEGELSGFFCQYPFCSNPAIGKSSDGKWYCGLHL